VWCFIVSLVCCGAFPEAPSVDFHPSHRSVPPSSIPVVRCVTGSFLRMTLSPKFPPMSWHELGKH
jgi:hypothetical protein